MSELFETMARELAELILSMPMVTPAGLTARKLARQIIGVEDYGLAPNVVVITTNGTTRLVPKDEPVFLLRGQDVAGGEAVRAWATIAAAHGAAPDILSIAREHAAKMDAWNPKKIPDTKA